MHYNHPLFILSNNNNNNNKTLANFSFSITQYILRTHTHTLARSLARTSEDLCSQMYTISFYQSSYQHNMFQIGHSCCCRNFYSLCQSSTPLFVLLIKIFRWNVVDSMFNGSFTIRLRPENLVFGRTFVWCVCVCVWRRRVCKELNHLSQRCFENWETMAVLRVNTSLMKRDVWKVMTALPKKFKIPIGEIECERKSEKVAEVAILFLGYNFATSAHQQPDSNWNIQL